MANGPETHPIWTIHLQKCAFTEQYRPVTPNWVAQKMYCLEKQTIYLWSRHSEYLTRIKLHKQLMNLCEVLMYWRKVSSLSEKDTQTTAGKDQQIHPIREHSWMSDGYMTYPCVCYIYRTNPVTMSRVSSGSIWCDQINYQKKYLFLYIHTHTHTHIYTHIYIWDWVSKIS